MKNAEYQQITQIVIVKGPASRAGTMIKSENKLIR